ncbi:hypothetical protein ACWAUC_19750 [Bradyrhizobium guangdongense]
MPALKPLAIARDYEGMHAAFRQYVEQINVSRATIDDQAGFADGLSGKALSPRPVRCLGRSTLGPFLQSVGLVLVVCQDVAEFERRRHRLPERDSRQVRMDNGRKRGRRSKEAGQAS